MTHELEHLTPQKRGPNKILFAIGRVWSRPALWLADIALRLNPAVTIVANVRAQQGVSVLVPSGSSAIITRCEIRSDLHPALEELTCEVNRLQRELNVCLWREREREEESQLTDFGGGDHG